MSQAPSTLKPPPAGKLGQIIAALSHPQGATLHDLATLTDWFPHTTRAALTRLRQRGWVISTRKNESGLLVYAVIASCQDRADVA